MTTSTSVSKKEETTATATTRTVNNSNKHLQQQKKRNLRVFSNDDPSSSSNIYNHRNNDYDQDDRNDSNNNNNNDDDDDDDNTLVLKFSIQSENHPTVGSILDWSFVEDLKLMMQDFLCQESPSLTIVNVDFDNDYDNNDNTNNNNININIAENRNDINNNNVNTFATIKSLCTDKEFDPIHDGQLLYPTALLTDKYNETSNSQWIGWEMRYPIWVVGEYFKQKESSSGLSAKQIMANVAQSTLNDGINDGTLDRWLESYNITSTNISITGKEYDQFNTDGGGVAREGNVMIGNSVVEPIEDDANVVRVIGYILLGFDILAVACLIYLGRIGKHRRLEREFTTKLLRAQQDSTTREQMDEMLCTSKQEIIDISSPSELLQDGDTKTKTDARRQQHRQQQTHKIGSYSKPPLQRDDGRHSNIETRLTSSSPFSADELMTNTKRQLSTILSSRNFTVDD